MLAKIFDATDCEKDVKGKFKVKREICGPFNNYLCGVLKVLNLSEHGQAKMPSSLFEKRTNTVYIIRSEINKNLGKSLTNIYYSYW